MEKNKIEREKSKPSRTKKIAPSGSTENKPKPAERRTENIELITLDSSESIECESEEEDSSLSDSDESESEEEYTSSSDLDEFDYPNWIDLLNLRMQEKDLEVVPIVDFYPMTVGFGIFHAKTSRLTIYLFMKKWFRPSKVKVALRCLNHNLRNSSSKKIQTTQTKYVYTELKDILFLFAAIAAEIATREKNWNKTICPVSALGIFSSVNSSSFKDQIMSILKLQSCEITSESKKQLKILSHLKNFGSKNKFAQNKCIKEKINLPTAFHSETEREKSKPSQTKNIAPGDSTEKIPKPAESKTENIKMITLDSKSTDRNSNFSDLNESQFEDWIHILNFRMFSRDLEIVPFIQNYEGGLACGFGIFNAKISKLTLYLFGKKRFRPEEVNERLHCLVKILKSQVLQDIKTTTNDNFPFILHEFPLLVAAMVAEFATLKENWNHELVQLKPPEEIANSHVSSFKNQILSILKFHKKMCNMKNVNIRQIYFAMRKRFRFLSYDKLITFENDPTQNEERRRLVKTLTKMYFIVTQLDRRVGE